jgi:diadenosine tetraphosphatase ApaH/serine/threonine PP2A family protein phosphatase
MRALVVADVHANLDALDAVLRDAKSRDAVDAIWCLGDTVGYAAEPDACIERLRSYPCEAIAGNHDLAAIGAIDTSEFNPHAAFAARWTGEHLSDSSRQWLLGLPSVIEVAGEFTLTHGSLLDPVWDYLVYPEATAAHFEKQSTPYAFVGHSHLPLVFYEDDGRRTLLADGAEVPLGGRRFVANPGSVGQPRDGDPRAAYAIVDTDARNVIFRRVEYDIVAAQAKIRAAGLPEILASRLAVGH